MPRSKLIYTHLYPYHITARSNNKESFYLPINIVWDYFNHVILEASVRFYFQVHAFVLMSNHYHMVATATEQYPVSKVMEWVQRSVNRKINLKANRINHVFGGPYRGSLITNELYYYHVIKYVYQNPIQAGVVSKVEDYKYSTLSTSKIPLVSPITGVNALIPKKQQLYINYLNDKFSKDEVGVINKSIKKTIMKIPSQINRGLRNSLI